MRITKQGKLKFKVTCPVCGEKRDGKKPQFKPCARCKREHAEKQASPKKLSLEELEKARVRNSEAIRGEKTAQECPTENDLGQGNMITRGENEESNLLSNLESIN